MKRFILAAFAALSLGVGVANAAVASHQPTQGWQGNPIEGGD